MAQSCQNSIQCYKNNLMNINQNSTIRNNKMLWFLRMQGLVSISSLETLDFEAFFLKLRVPFQVLENY